MTDATKDMTPVHVVSFGFQYGIPLGATVLRDVRDLRNPYTDEPGLKQFNGLDSRIQQWVMAQDGAAEILDDLTEMAVHAAHGHWRRRQRTALVAVGCTGGKHRSVTMVEFLARRLRDDYRMAVEAAHLHLNTKAPDTNAHLLHNLTIAAQTPR